MASSTLPFHAVCLGGGTGVALIARALFDAGMRVTTVIATTDNGRSTGRVRRWFNMPAPGDLRNVLASFASEPALRELFDYRLDLPELAELRGVAFGNLVLAVLTKTTGSLETAVAVAGRLGGVPIRVIPVTTANAELCAELEDGALVQGEVEVRRPGKAPIRRLFVMPPAPATEAALQAIREADLITIGPGSLFTSVLACLAVDGIVEALVASRARRMYIANTTTQPGQSDGMPLVAQIERVIAAARGAIDAVLVNEGRPAAPLIARHAAAGRHLLSLSPAEREELERRGVRVIAADLVEHDAPPRALWQKEDTIRHDAAKVGAIFTRLAAEARA
ncbi:MAG: YvcK family protein [Chloroflexota bacterium]|nr:YvcK family protein [Dehalococcoidia bacterium]MDW8254173.1 YvcK family protein [Chloroflexota bacterium]